MNEKVIRKAQELAASIAISPEFIAMRMAEEAATQDEELVSLFTRYSEAQQKIQEISAQDKPDFNELGKASKEFNDLKDAIQNAPLSQKMQAARQEFSDMMNAVNAELTKLLSPGEASCSGNCGTCGGCH